MAGKKPGSPKTGGRKKGTPNKMTADVKGMILSALDKAGGTNYLLQQAQTNPTAFLTLVGKVLPKEITGDGGGPIKTVSVIRLVAAGNG